jgi:hypothetical protein
MAKSKTRHKKPVGNPSGYSDNLIDKICLALVTPVLRPDEIEGSTPHLRSLRAILEEMKTPHMSMLMRWLSDPKMAYLREQMRLAYETRAEIMADELLEISDENPREITTITQGDRTSEIDRTDGAGVQRNRLRVDTRKWIASRLLPKKYGDKVELGVTEGLAAVMASIKDIPE